MYKDIYLKNLICVKENKINGYCDRIELLNTFNNSIFREHEKYVITKTNILTRQHARGMKINHHRAIS